MKFLPPYVIAEIGCNHKGDEDIAKELIRLAKSCGAQVAKFQKRNPKELLNPEQYASPHPNAHHAYGKTYGEHREFLEFDLDTHARLMEYCQKKRILYSTSVWDVSSAKAIMSLKPAFIKIPSATNTHFALLELLRDQYEGDIHLSFGMTTKKEEEEIIQLFEKKGQSKERLVIYSCTSGYPVQPQDVCLLEITRLIKQYRGRVKQFGFSGHHNGIALDIAAYALGASVIERHFTKDRTWKGTDHAASLEAPGLSKLVRDLKEAYVALRFKKADLLPVEIEQRNKLKYQAPA